MKAGLKRNLLIIDLLTVIFIIIISLLPLSVLRVVLGLPFLLFFPGYTLLAALIPGRGSGDGIERVALSFGVSFLAVALVGLVLNFTPWGIRLYPLLIVLAVLIVLSSLAAWWRCRALVDEETAPPVHLRRFFPWREVGLTGKLVTSVLAVFILVALGSLIYIMVVPRSGESFTEFYILGGNGKAQDYPLKLRIGEAATVKVVVACHENQPADYFIEIAVDGAYRPVGGVFRLGNGEQWEGEAVFSLKSAGNGQKVAFVLFKNGEAYRTLYLQVDVTG